jgi:hypothetical protein
MIHFITICATNKYPNPAKAIDIYKGGYWGVVKEIDTIVDKTWIISAKYGLISADKIIEPYKISFKPDSQDYVGHMGTTPTEYWDFHFGAPIRDLISSNPNDKFILYVSNAYMRAIKNDIDGVLDNPNLYIFSPDTKGKRYEGKILETSLKVKEILGGNKISITAITIKHFLNNITRIGWDKSDINAYFNEMTRNIPEYSYIPHKEKINDNELVRVIGEIGLFEPKTKILKIIGGRGLACGPNRLNRILYKLRKTNK